MGLVWHLWLHNMEPYIGELCFYAYSIVERKEAAYCQQDCFFDTAPRNLR